MHFLTNFSDTCDLYEKQLIAFLFSSTMTLKADIRHEDPRTTFNVKFSNICIFMEFFKRKRGKTSIRLVERLQYNF